MVRSPDPLPLRCCLALVDVFSHVVPRGRRREWREEWASEFRHRHEVLAARGELDWSSNMDLVRRAMGALTDAAWVRRQFTADAEVVHDVRHGWRMLRKSPSFTIAAIMILAVGIGGTVAIATLLDTLWFRPLPYADAERIVTVWQRPASGERADVAPANFLDWRERSQSFETLAAVIPSSYDFTDTGEPEVIFGAQVTEGFFDAIGTAPLLGRAFLPGEHVRGARRVVLITHTVWQRRFGADPQVVNRPMKLDDITFTIVGVLPAGFAPQLLPRPGELGVWTPKVIQGYESRIRDSAWWNVVGRTKRGVSIEQAESELNAITAALAREHPGENHGLGVEVVPFRDHLMGDLRLPLLIMFAAALLVLAIGCANVASLLMARGIEREREFAIRAALGASRARIVRQLVVESLLLSLLAAAAGVGLAYWLIGGIVSLAPAGILRLQEAALDGRIATFAAVLTTATALAFGLLPAIQFANPVRGLVRGRQGGALRAGARRTLVVAEVALAVVLLTGAGLLLRSFERLLAVDPGFSSMHTVALQVFAYDRNPTPERLRTFFSETIDRLSRLPGVEAAGAVSAMPFASANIDVKSPLGIVGRPPQPGGGQRPVYVTVATPGFFPALSVPIREGRSFDERDRATTPMVAVISEALRRREWPAESPIGRRIRIAWQGQQIESEIIGVAGDIRHDGLDSAPRAEVFVPLEQVPFGSMTYVLRGSGDAATLIDAARRSVWSVDPLQTFYETRAVEQMIAASLVRQRFSAALLGGLAGVALVLCAIGIYGVVSFATAQRTREIGVRMALGADRASIRRMVLREGSGVVAAGMLIGLLVSLAATRSLQKLLFEVRAIDPVTMAAVCVLLAAVALLACYGPARRATRVDPIMALRAE